MSPAHPLDALLVDGVIDLTERGDLVAQLPGWTGSPRVAKLSYAQGLTLGELAALPWVGTVEELELKLWTATPAEARALAEAATSLQMLKWTGQADLRDDGGIGDDGAKALARGLPSLRALRLDLQGIGEPGARALSGSWPELSRLDLRGNPIETADWALEARWSRAVLELDGAGLAPGERARLEAAFGERLQLR